MRTQTRSLIITGALVAGCAAEPAPEPIKIASPRAARGQSRGGLSETVL